MRHSEVDAIPLPMLAVDAWQLLGAKTHDDARALTLELVRRLYEKGLRPGDYWGGELEYWPDEGCQAALDRIEREWIAMGEEPNLGEPICWFGRPDESERGRGAAGGGSNPGARSILLRDDLDRFGTAIRNRIGGPQPE